MMKYHDKLTHYPKKAQPVAAHTGAMDDPVKPDGNSTGRKALWRGARAESSPGESREE